MQDLSVEQFPGLHRYAPPQGLPQLIDAIVARTREKTQTPTERENVLVATGATGALGAAMGGILDAGDEVLILSPYWPLISGIVRCFGGVPVEVPFIGTPAERDPDLARGQLERYLSQKSVALYINTPNNPTGKVLSQKIVETLVGWAEQNELWIVSDEVYEDYVYAGRHAYARQLAPDRTFSAYSFSKAYGMAGNRCGYVVGPERAMSALRKVATHAWYSTPTASQLAATQVLDGRGDAWVERVRPIYRELGDFAAAKLQVEPPQGSTFLFVDVQDRLDDRGLLGFLETCAENGLFLAPGPSFGDYPNHVRLCFTAAPPEVVRRGVDLLASLLGR